MSFNRQRFSRNLKIVKLKLETLQGPVSDSTEFVNSGYLWDNEMKFAELVCFEATVPQLNATDRDGVIKELVSSLDKAKRLGNADAQEIIQAIIKREKEASTGMGKGVAVPHVKHSAVKEIVAVVGQSSKGIDFPSLDKHPVYSVILMVSPIDDPDKHLQAMEIVFKHLQQEKFRKFLRQSHSIAEIEDLFKEADENSFL